MDRAQRRRLEHLLRTLYSQCAFIHDGISESDAVQATGWASGPGTTPLVLDGEFVMETSCRTSSREILVTTRSFIRLHSTLALEQTCFELY